MPDRRVRGIVFGGHEFHILVSEPEVVDRFLNQICVFVSDMTELGGWYAHEKNSVAGVAIPRRLQPGVVGMPVDFLFQGVEDAHPRVRDDGGTGERHCLSEYRKRRRKNVRERPVLKLCVRRFLQSRACFAVRVVCEIYYETNRILAQKNRRGGLFEQKNSARALYPTAIFFCCQVSRN